MRNTIPAFIPWLAAGLLGLAIVIVYVILTSSRSPDLLTLSIVSAGVFLVVVSLWWADTTHASRTSSNIAIAFFSSGWILIAVLPYLQVNGLLDQVLDNAGFIVGGAGAWYIFTKERVVSGRTE